MLASLLCCKCCPCTNEIVFILENINYPLFHLYFYQKDFDFNGDLLINDEFNFLKVPDQYDLNGGIENLITLDSSASLSSFLLNLHDLTGCTRNGWEYSDYINDSVNIKSNYRGNSNGEYKIICTLINKRGIYA